MRSVSFSRPMRGHSGRRGRRNCLVVLGKKLIAVCSEAMALDDQGAVWIGKVKEACSREHRRGGNGVGQANPILVTNASRSPLLTDPSNAPWVSPAT
jgi:hypothetical protein